MKRLKFIAILVLILAAILIWPSLSKTVCDEPLRYSIGGFEDEFGISQEELKNLLIKTEEVWEEHMGMELFTYDNTSDFKVNLIFDKRQQLTQDQKQLKEKITESAGTYESLTVEYETLHTQYQDRLKEYEERVSYWNERGGAPEEDYNRLQRERHELSLMAHKLNSLTQQINELAQTHNLEVRRYNARFSVPRTFDQGEYNGREINIYQFETINDLRLVLAHEFGHALRLNHVNNPQSVMYYLMKEQRLNPVKLTQEDLQALKEKCRL